MVDTLTHDDEATVADELEGLLAIDSDPETLMQVAQFRAIRDQRDTAVEALDELKTKLLAKITERDAQAFTLDGKVVARKSRVTTNRLDAKSLEAQLPDVYKKYMIATSTVRLSVP